MRRWRGNSAGQAALRQAPFATRVTLLVRGESLAASTSDYLITQLKATPKSESGSAAQGLVKVGVTVRDLMAGWFGGAGLAWGGVPLGCPGAGGCDGA